MTRLSARENEMASHVVDMYQRAKETKEDPKVAGTSVMDFADLTMDMAICELWMLTQ